MFVLLIDSKGSFKFNQGLAVLRRIVEKLGDQVYQFIKDMANHEKELNNSKLAF